MLIVKFTAMLISYFIISILAGNAICRIVKINNESVLRMYDVGMLTTMALYEITYVPLMFNYSTLTMQTTIWGLLVAVLITAGVVISVRDGIKVHNIINDAVSSIINIKAYHVFMIVMCMTYIIIVLMSQREYQDDSFFVGLALTSYATDLLIKHSPYTGRTITLEYLAKYILAGYPAYIASVSSIFHIQPIIVMHSIIPVIFISIHYVIYYSLAEIILKSKKWASYAIGIMVYLRYCL